MGICSSKSKQTQIQLNNREQEIHQDALNGLNIQESPCQPSYEVQTETCGLTIKSSKPGRITRDYTLLNPPIWKGPHSEVRKAIHKQTNVLRAVKVIKKSQRNSFDQQKIINEVQTLQNLDHPNIIKIFEFYEDDQFFYIVNELCTGGELFEKIRFEGSFSERKASIALKQIFSAINYCHQVNIIHRDLKPENLLYENNSENALLKVIDFGTTRQLDNQQKNCGSLYYMAPEVLKNQYNEKCDIWSCGVILYILLCGYPPFDGKNEGQIIEKINKGILNFNGQEWDDISKEAKEFIKLLLNSDPNERYSAAQALKHNWIKKYNTTKNIEIGQLRKVLMQMKQFHGLKKLQEAFFTYMVSFLTTKEEKADILQIFQSLDSNSDGKISKDELYNGFLKIMSKKEAELEANRVFAITDKNNSGYIDYTEFLVATMDREKVCTKDRLEITFKLFDKDKSGSIDLEELKDIFCAISDDYWREVVQEVDENSDGQISLEEFCRMMLSTKL